MNKTTKKLLLGIALLGTLGLAGCGEEAKFDKAAAEFIQLAEEYPAGLKAIEPDKSLPKAERQRLVDEHIEKMRANEKIRAEYMMKMKAKYAELEKYAQMEPSLSTKLAEVENKQWKIVSSKPRGDSINHQELVMDEGIDVFGGGSAWHKYSLR